MKPSILRDISEENQLAPQPPRFHFVDETDTLVLEDERQRIRLIGSMDVHQFVTGIVCAILGEFFFVFFCDYLINLFNMFTIFLLFMMNK